jgi:hypothetical protein
MKEEVIKKIVYFGERYGKELRENHSKKFLEEGWYGGLSLLLSHSFFQGRRDEISDIVREAAMPILDQLFKGKDVSALAECNFSSLRQDLFGVIGKGKIGKGRDVLMIVSMLKFVQALPGDKNLVRYSVQKIKDGDIKELYDQLIKEIVQVGSKIASFYLRDLVDLYGLDQFENCIQTPDFAYLQPIDVWVRAVALKTGIIDDDRLSGEKVRESILEVCHGLKVPSFRFNQGAWYVGKKSFSILLEHLDEITTDN